LPFIEILETLTVSNFN